MMLSDRQSQPFRNVPLRGLCSISMHFSPNVLQFYCDHAHSFDFHSGPKCRLRHGFSLRRCPAFVYGTTVALNSCNECGAPSRDPTFSHLPLPPRNRLRPADRNPLSPSRGTISCPL